MSPFGGPFGGPQGMSPIVDLNDESRRPLKPKVVHARHIQLGCMALMFLCAIFGGYAINLILSFLSFSFLTD